ncbi:metallophosphoesterase [Corallococcus sp. BB11-1]|uniref:metallophosphoesterase n=1 Tax=Corallococcus sp. BB11-1 TaxID=2996783 RepID=UPI00226E676D|nr:metallophosphoesterase [Corallococcus sp. BB11-1]MCY1032644.1 metallophosphoesterase [Corallococcus sp. BB11-1]
MARLNWLHFSDLQIRAQGSPLLQTEYRDALEKDLRRLHARSGPWDLVFISGDLTKAGTQREFEVVGSTLDALWKFFHSLGSNPTLLVVPGNHEFLRGTLVRGADARVAFQKASDPDTSSREIRTGLAPFTEWFSAWRNAHPAPALRSFRQGLLPGDFAATVEKDGMRVGIVGLNSIFRTGAHMDPTDSHEVDIQQLDTAMDNDPLGWARNHELVVLLSHHGPPELQSQSLEQLSAVVTPAHGFLLHLCGSARIKNVFSPEKGVSTPSIYAPSLFGWAGPQPGLRRWGYVAGTVETHAGRPAARLTLSSRVATQSRTGMTLVPDERLHAPLEESFSTDLSPSRNTSLGLGAALALVRSEGSRPKSDRAGTRLRVMARPPEPTSDVPAGMTYRETLDTGHAGVGWMAWDPSGVTLAVGLSDGRFVSWRPGRSAPHPVQAHETEIVDLCFAADGGMLASRSNHHVYFWNADGTRARDMAPVETNGMVVAWSPTGLVAFDNAAGEVLVWERVDQMWMGRARVRSNLASVFSMAWSPGGDFLAVGGSTQGGQGTFIVFHVAPNSTQLMAQALEQRVEGHGDVLDVTWHPVKPWLALASRDRTVRVWNTARDTPVAVLEGNTDAVVGVSFSSDGYLLASKSLDGSVRLYRTDTWTEVAKLEEPASPLSFAGLAFSPTDPVLATLAPEGVGVRLWDIDVAALVITPEPLDTMHVVSAKVVLVGEGRAGKSCLAQRMTEDRYEDLGSTHGMRFWTLPVPPEPGSDSSHREVILWDMGGQSEYQLVHQLFLHDSSLALLVMEPGRGKPALDEVEGWNQRFLVQTTGRTVRRLLVGTKVDDAHAPVDPGAIQPFVQRLGFTDYISTSARAGLGITELKALLARTVPWDTLEKVSRPELFQRLHEYLQQLRGERRVVITFPDLEVELRRELGGPVDAEALQAVVAQLARRGLLADTRMADTTRALILDVEQVERYAGSLILAARDNPHGVPAIDVAKMRSRSMQFPRIRPEERLRRDQELIVLDCVTQLLIEHGLCLQHEGLLIFPSLFRPLPPERAEAFPYSVSLHYDFAGPVDNIYASLVTSLAMSRGFGQMRLWEDRAEFSWVGAGMVGVRCVQRGTQGTRGFARMDLYFDSETSRDKRELFASFVETHLAEHGVELVEGLSITCKCGQVFEEKVVLARIEAGQADIGCQVCDCRAPLMMGARAAQTQDPELVTKTRVLRTRVQEQRSQSITETKVLMAEADRLAPAQEETPIRILHLSDLHVGAGQDPINLLEPLLTDLRDREDGLGVERVDYLVISGDITNRATPEEFEQAREFVSQLIHELGLTSERCIIVPGNHDLHWDTDVYNLKKKRQVSEKDLKPGMFHQTGDVYFVRDEVKYPERFRHFSERFYHPLMQKEYPLSEKHQCIPFLFSDTHLQFLAMNSAWEIDEHFRDRSSVNDSALSRGLVEAERQVAEARKAGTLAADAKVLRLGVWHHPITGNEKIQADAFMQRLQKADVRVCLHGHVHEDRADLFGYMHPTRRIHVVGAGSFGAPTAGRPESVPRLYNLLTVKRDLSGIRVHTRSLPKQGGSWGPHAVWKGPEKNVMRAFYEVPMT